MQLPLAQDGGNILCPHVKEVRYDDGEADHPVSKEHRHEDTDRIYCVDGGEDGFIHCMCYQEGAKAVTHNYINCNKRSSGCLSHDLEGE